ncbi:hypothetical protein KUF71_002032 [Frankliniella fusca]|uniref:Uncharacterized protein n=1 Tax=Frankliniella fusca TaxID=407009 RepID=A0AAE1HLW2_9NEOP|nr:hypothetical protein KUF71_002032 [Frankliniella fusca]
MLKFGTIVGMKVMDQSSYRDHLLKLVSENEALKEEILSLARQAVRRFYEEENPNLVNEEIIEVHCKLGRCTPDTVSRNRLRESTRNTVALRQAYVHLPRPAALASLND